MKLITTILFLIILNYGCKEAYKEHPTLVRSFQNTGNWDSVYLYSDGHLVITQSVVRQKTDVQPINNLKSFNDDIQSTVKGLLIGFTKQGGLME